MYRCLDAETGEQRWEVKQLAINSFDYGNSPRATPLIDGNRVFLFGASGDLLCVDIEDGAVIWQLNVKSQFGAKAELPWGYCGSPLLVDQKLIVNPGAENASLVALDPKTGEVIWQSPGRDPGYGSLIAGRFGGRLQIVGHDATTLGGWDVDTGERLWTVQPEHGDDFNVPTPVNLDGKLLITTENNGTRLFDFNSDGKIVTKPVATNRRLSPNMSSPVVANGLVFCADKFLYCLDPANGLKEVWRQRHPALTDYCAILASRQRLLVIGAGELLLVNADATGTILDSFQVFEDDTEIYSHAALVGNRLYLRGEDRLICLQFENAPHKIER